MIFRINPGRKWNRYCLVAKEFGAAMHETIDNSSMRCFGFYEPEHPDVICRRAMEIGKIRTVVSAAGATKESGNDFWSS